MKPRICQWTFTISFVLIDIKIASKIKISDQWILLFLHTIKFLGFEEAKIPVKGWPIQPINAPHLYTPEEEKRAIHMCTGMHSCSCGCTIWVCLKTYPKIFQINWDKIQHKKKYLYTSFPNMCDQATRWTRSKNIQMFLGLNYLIVVLKLSKKNLLRC